MTKWNTVKVAIAAGIITAISWQFLVNRRSGEAYLPILTSTRDTSAQYSCAAGRRVAEEQSCRCTNCEMKAGSR